MQQLKNDEVEAMMDSNVNLFRKNVRFLRKDANDMTADKVAEGTGLSRDSIYRLENPSERYPNLRTVLKVCIFYGKSIGEMMERDLEYEEMKSLKGDA